MAINLHTDPKFEKCLDWLSKQSQKTKTDIIKELVLERYHLKKCGFEFGALKSKKKTSSLQIQKELKRLDHDLD